MAIEYEAKEWQNDSVGGTPITADEMNRIDSGVADAVNGVNELNEPGNVTTDDLADGAVTADKLSQEVRDSVSQIEAGYLTVQAKANETVSARIEFAAPFASDPSVIAAANTSWANAVGVSVSEATEEGATINVFRDTNASTGIYWIATERS